MISNSTAHSTQHTAHLATYNRSFLNFNPLKLILFNLLVIFSLGAKSQLTVSSTTTWMALPLGYEKGITVNSNVSLTIGSLILNMDAGKSITLGTGSKLILSGTTIDCSNTNALWTGIVASGVSIEQFATFPDTKIKNSIIAWDGVLNTSQTLITLNNNCFIKNATNGIVSNNGAIIRSKNTTYENCVNGVKINSYRSATQPKKNACYFMNDQFNWDNNVESISGFTLLNIIGIQLTDVGTINIGACTFDNKNTTAHCLLERGIGIKAESSDFTAEKDGNKFCVTLDCSGTSEAAENCGGGTTGCVFKNLFNGIKATSSSTRNDQIIARHSTFTDNYLGVSLERLNTSGLYDNTFSINRTNVNALFDNSSGGCSVDYYSTDILRDINSDAARQLRILDNKFNCDNKWIEHISINASNGGGGGTSLIKKNIFNAPTASNYKFIDDVFGIILLGNNATLDILCNKFYGYGCDIYNTVSSTLSSIPLAPINFHANNEFSAKLSGRYNLYNDGTWSGDYVRKSSGWNASWGPSISSISVSNNGIDPNCFIVCSDFTNIINNSGAGIFNHSKNSIIKLFPNPAQDKINIELNSSDYYNSDLIANIYSLDGKLVLSSKLKLNEVSINGLMEGVYMVQIVKDNQLIIGNTKLAIIK